MFGRNVMSIDFLLDLKIKEKVEGYIKTMKNFKISL